MASGKAGQQRADLLAQLRHRHARAGGCWQDQNISRAALHLGQPHDFPDPALDAVARHRVAKPSTHQHAIARDGSRRSTVDRRQQPAPETPAAAKNR
jgi:hypothetical protein